VIGIKFPFQYFSSSTDGWTVGKSDTDLEETLRACVLDLGNEWIESLPYVELAYNISYQSSIGMALFKDLYGHKCQTLLYWACDGKVSKEGEVYMQEMSEKVKVVREHLKVIQSRHKSYADNRRRNSSFKWEMLYFLD
jgi:hypothetical protein